MPSLAEINVSIDESTHECGSQAKLQQLQQLQQVQLQQQVYVTLHVRMCGGIMCIFCNKQVVCGSSSCRDKNHAN